MALDLRASELEHNFIKGRVSSVDKHFDEICSKIRTYVKKLACLRDSGDDVAKSISSFASKETYNQTLRLTLGEFSDVLSSIQEYRDAQIQRIDVKVTFELDNYSAICKQTKDEIKECFDARAKELKKKNELEKIRSKQPRNWQKIAKVEKEVNQAQDEAARTAHELANQVERFERKKIEDLKKAFMELVKIELIFHAKAIELYTKSYNILKEINVEEDLNEFKSHFKPRATLDIEMSPQMQATIPKTVDMNLETSNINYLEIPYPKQGIQGTPRSIFTMKSRPVEISNSSSTLDSYMESKFENGT